MNKQRINSLMQTAHVWITTLFGHDWHIFDNESHKLLVILFIIR
jgi:hypothetical protein